MNKKIKIISIAVSTIILFLITGRILLLFLFNNVKTGEYKASPNGIYEATIYTCTTESFFGEYESWYEYKVINLKTEEVLHQFNTDPIDGPFFGSRSSHSVIKWDQHSNKVFYIFPKTEIILKLN
jgi:hypothetical protein